MFTTNSLTIEQIVLTHIPGYAIREINGEHVIHFGLHDILFNQHAIVAFWRACNHYHLQPVAKTILGRVKSIKFSF